MSWEREGELKLLTGSANPELAHKLADYLGVSVAQADIGRFSNGEIRVNIEENVRGTDVFIVQPTSAPVNDNLMELLLMIDACRRSSAHRITAVIPYYGYARQDRKTRSREPISAKLVANLITVAGADRVLTMDLHAPQLQGFFDIPVDNLFGNRILADHIASLNLENPMVFSPDAGGVFRARQLAKYLGCPLGFIDKRRPEPNVSEVVNVVGKVKGKTVILVDDMIDTGGTIAQAAVAVLELGATAVYACATHPVFSGRAAETLNAAPIRSIVVTDTIPLHNAPRQTEVISVAPLLGEAIMRVHEHLSVSKLFE
ncbi:MAG: ribose-phosphate pyrophosphokinase [Actinomycetia bacterium]|nr:ribose-phosphate pyrophosphokinase [Actinomycetes bacterium]